MKIFFVLCSLFGWIGCVHSQVIAVANIHLDSSTTPVGTILFNQRSPTAPVRIVGILDGLKNNTVHGFHVHRDALMNGELNCTAAGPHYNPYNVSHGPRGGDLMSRHVGDLGNLTANDNGVIVIELADVILDFYNFTRSVSNRTIVLHAMRDDGGSGGFPDSNTTGNAGPRIACGVISLTMQDTKTKGNSFGISKFFDKLFS